MIVGLGVMPAVLGGRTAQRYADEVEQKLNRTLADEMVPRFDTSCKAMSCPFSVTTHDTKMHTNPSRWPPSRLWDRRTATSTTPERKKMRSRARASTRPHTGPDGEGSIAETTNTDDDRFLDNNGFKYEETANALRVTITPQN